MSIWKWKQWLPAVDNAACLTTLGEGNTPLVRSRRIGPQAGLANLAFKLESANPTGSYKDRFAAAAVSHMLACNQRQCLATSSGNTGAALAAYCAAAGITCRIAVLETTPMGKLKQMLAYGATIYRVRGFGLDAAASAQVVQNLNKRAAAPDAALQISAFHFSPLGMSGVQTLGYELAEQTRDQPLDHVFAPAGGGGLTLAVARGLKQAVDQQILPRPVRVHCVQPAGNDTIATPLREGLDTGRQVGCTSLISGLQVATPYDGDDVIRLCRDSGGTGHTVTDQEIWAMQKRLAREEGIFAEPAGAVAAAAAVKAAEQGLLDPQAHIACLVTGTGFKDFNAVDRMIGCDEVPICEPSDI